MSDQPPFDLSAFRQPLFQEYMAAVDTAQAKHWHAFLTEESDQNTEFQSLISTQPMRDLQLRRLASSLLTEVSWPPQKRHLRLSLVTDWINYCNVRGNTDLQLRMATTTLVRPKNPFQIIQTATALTLYARLKDALYESVTQGIDYSPRAHLGRALLSGILFGGLLCERNIWALLSAIRDRPINLNGLPAYLLTIRRNGIPDAETHLWVPDALTGTFLGNLYLNGIDLDSVIPGERHSGYIMSLIQSWIGESTDLNILNIINEIAAIYSNKPNGSEGKNHTRLTLKVLLELIGIKYKQSVHAVSVDYMSGLLASHSLPLSRIDNTSSRIGTAPDGALTIPEDDIGAEDPSVLDQAAASLDTAFRGIASSIQVEASTTPTTLPTAKSLGHGQWTPELLGSTIRSHFAGSDAATPMARLLVEWSQCAMGSMPAKTTHHALNGFRQSFNRCYALLPATDQDIDLGAMEADWFEGVYGELLDDCPRSQKRHDAGFLSKFHRHLVETQGAARLRSSDTFQDMRRRPQVHADLITIDEFSEVMDTLLNQGTRVGNGAFLKLNARHPDLPRVVALIAVLGYRCGLRRREALHLRLCDIHGFHKTCLLVRPHKIRRLKTLSSIRLTPPWALLEPAELALLIRWTQHRLAETGHDLYQPLFAIPSLNPGTVSEDLVFPSIHRILRAITGRPDHRFHLFRHSCASLLLLKLVAGKSQAAQCWFACYPKTLDWLRDGDSLQRALTNTWGPTRKNLYAVSALLGHSAPDVSLEHYVHVLDIISADQIQTWRQHPRSVLINASALVPATARRALADGWAPFVLRHWEKPHKFGTPVTAWIPANQSIDLTTENTAEWPPLVQIARAANLVISSRDGAAVERLQRDMGWTEERSSGFVANVECLFGLTKDDSRECPAAAGEVDYVRKADPSAYRSSVDWKLADEDTKWWFQKLQKLALSDASAFDQFVNTYTRLSHKDGFHVILKGKEDIAFYQHLITTLNIPKSKIIFTHLVGKRSKKDWINPGKLTWRKELGLTKNIVIKRLNINNSITVGEHGWIGLKVLEDFTHSGKFKGDSPRASQMFPFVMNSMVLGKGVFW